MSNSPHTISVLLVFRNCPKYKADRKSPDALIEYLPATSSQSNVYSITADNISEVAEKIRQTSPDLIIHYGLGAGVLWEGNFNQWNDSGEVIEIDTLSDNHTLDELFYTEKYLFTTFFDLIKEKMLAIDMEKSRPSKLLVATTKKQLQEIKERCFDEPFGFDTETNFLNPFLRTIDPQILCYSIAWPSDEELGWCIPANEQHIKTGNCEFSFADVQATMRKIFFESEQVKFAHNLAFDLLALFECFDGAIVKNATIDTMLLCNIYHNAGKSAKLADNLCLVDMPSYKDPVKAYVDNIKSKKAKAATGFADVPLSVIAPYAAMDAIAVARLFNFFRKNLGKTQWELYYNIAYKILKTSFELCYEGYTISKDRYYYTKHKVEKEVDSAYKSVIATVSEHIPAEFNINSSDQVADLFYNKLQLPVTSKTNKGKPSVDEKALNNLMLFHPVIFKLLRFKKTIKLYNTYVTTYPNVLGQGARCYKKTQRWTINSQYKQTNRTARLSASNLPGHAGTDKTGGNVLVLPGSGSLVKHYFGPEPVIEKENDLFDAILEQLKTTDAESYNKFMEWSSHDASIKFSVTKQKKAAAEAKRKQINDAAKEVISDDTDQSD